MSLAKAAIQTTVLSLNKGIAREAKSFMMKNAWARTVGSIAAASFGPVSYAYYQATITAMSGGSMSDVVKTWAISYVSAEAMGEIGDGLKGKTPTLTKTDAIFLHGMVGGVSAAASGGDMKGAIIGSMAGKYITLETKPLMESIGDVGRFSIVTMTGGITAELGGGKFSDGARSAAFGYMFNELGKGQMGRKQRYPKSLMSPAQQASLGVGMVEITLSVAGGATGLGVLPSLGLFYSGVNNLFNAYNDDPWLAYASFELGYGREAGRSIDSAINFFSNVKGVVYVPAKIIFKEPAAEIDAFQLTHSIGSEAVDNNDR